MKIVFNRQKLLGDITPLLCAVSNKSTIRSIEGILIEAIEPNTCVLTSYDTEKGVRITIDAKVIEGGSYIINAQKFVGTLKVMPGSEVTLAVDNTLNATFSSGTSSHRMSAINGSDFPELPKLRTNFGFTVSQHVVKEMITKCQHAMAVADPRPILNGCYFEIRSNSLLTIACDSFRMAKCTTVTELENNNENKSDLRFTFIIPARTVNELLRMLDSDKEKDLKMRVYMSRRQIIFEIGRLTFFSSLIEGQYLDYERILGTVSRRIVIKLDRNEAVECLERASLITEEKIAGSICSHVKLNIESGVLKIHAESPSGSTYDEIKLEHEGDNLLIAFRNRYLLDSLRACTADRIKISLSSNLSGIIIEPDEETENDTEMFFLLPVKMK